MKIELKSNHDQMIIEHETREESGGAIKHEVVAGTRTEQWVGRVCLAKFNPTAVGNDLRS